MEKFGKNIFTETICKESTSRVIGGSTNTIKQSSNISVQNNSKNKLSKDKDNEEISKNGKHNVVDNKYDSKKVKENISVQEESNSSLEGFSNKKLKNLIHLYHNSNSIKLEEIQTVTWNGLPFGNTIF